MLRNEVGEQKPRSPMTWRVWGIFITTFVTVSPNFLPENRDKKLERIVLS